MENIYTHVNEPIRLVSCDMLNIKGRYTVSEQYLEFDWTNSGFEFSFCGSGFMLTFGGYTADQPAFIRIKLDGRETRRYAVVNGNEAVIVEGLRFKEHTVEVLKITEGEPKLKFNTLSLFGEGAQLSAPKPVSERRIEFVGDSITCGYGVLGMHTDPTYFTYQQDGTRGYAYMTAEKLGADARFIAISGKGIVCNCNGDRSDIKAGEYFELQSRTGGICNDGWTADVVVINIGTNDCGGPAPDDEFVSAAKELIAKERARYPEAHIVWAYGMMSELYRGLLAKIIRDVRKTDKKVHYVSLATVFGNQSETGANGHPNVRASIRVSNILSRKIRTLTGWKK